MQTEFPLGTRLRSFDFEHNRTCYVEGVLTGYKNVEGCNRYVIRVEKQVFGGTEVTDGSGLVGRDVYPPVNGTPTFFGGETKGVEEVK